MCGRNKKPYLSKKEALQDIAFIRYSEPDGPVQRRLHAYWCESCGAWHIGKRSKKRGRDMIRGVGWML